MAQHTRTGPGFAKGTPLTPEQIAARLEAFTRGRAMRKRKHEDFAAMAAELIGMPLDEIRKKATSRQWLVATLHVGGYDNAQIARVMGYASRNVVHRLMDHPVVKALVDRIQQAQLQKVIDGEFGVQAAAKAAAPKVVKQIIRKAGGAENQEGVAARDADMLRAGETVLRISGDLVEKRQDVHMHLLGQLDDTELTAFASTGEWPERYRHILGTLGMDEDARKGLPAPIDVTSAR